MPIPVKSLIQKMYNAFNNGKERDQYKGVIPRRWFIDNMGESTYEKLLDDFDSQIHDDNWHGLWSNKWSKTIDKVVEARSVAFMDSGHRSVYEHYMDDEVHPIQRSRHYEGNFLFMKPELDIFFTRKNPDGV